jgi:hypothetical protein
MVGVRVGGRGAFGFLVRKLGGRTNGGFGRMVG